MTATIVQKSPTCCSGCVEEKSDKTTFTKQGNLCEKDARSDPRGGQRNHCFCLLNFLAAGQPWDQNTPKSEKVCQKCYKKDAPEQVTNHSINFAFAAAQGAARPGSQLIYCTEAMRKHKCKAGTEAGSPKANG